MLWANRLFTYSSAVRSVLLGSLSRCHKERTFRSCSACHGVHLRQSAPFAQRSLFLAATDETRRRMPHRVRSDIRKRSAPFAPHKVTVQVGWFGGALPLLESLRFGLFWRLRRQNGPKKGFAGACDPRNPRWRTFP